MGFRDLPISEVEQEEELDEQTLAILIDRHSLRLQEVQQLSRARVSLQSSDRAPSQNVLIALALPPGKKTGLPFIQTSFTKITGDPKSVRL